jgi:hypothetical protein
MTVKNFGESDLKMYFCCTYGARENLYEFRVTNDIFVEEDKVHQETHQPAVSHLQTCSHSCIKYATDGIELVILVMIGTDCTTIRSRTQSLLICVYT